MNKIILPPTILSALLPNHTRIEGNNNAIYLIRESYRPNKTTISKLYELFFGIGASASGNQYKEDGNNASPEYFCNYE
jgi:hypothetical protein